MASPNSKTYNCLSIVTISGHIKSAQAFTNEKIPKAARDGLERGITTLRKTPSSEQPSIRAESSISSGMLSIFCFKKKIPKLLIIPGKMILEMNQGCQD